MEIRRLVDADAEAWWTARLESLENEPQAFGRSAAEHRATTLEEAHQRFRAAPQGSFSLGAFADGELVGFASCVRETGDKERHKAHVFGVYVKPAKRGQGIARALLSALIERAADDPSVEQLLLSVARSQLAARQLYGDLGFQTYGLEPNSLKIGDSYIDEDLMILRLRPKT